MADNLPTTIKINPITLVLGNPLEREHIKNSLQELGYELQQIEPLAPLPPGTVVLENYLSYLNTLEPSKLLKAYSALQARYFSNLEDKSRTILVETGEKFSLAEDLLRFIKIYKIPRPTATQIEQIYLDRQLETTDKTIGYGRGLTTPELTIAIKEAKLAELAGDEFWGYIDDFRKHKLDLLGLKYKPVPKQQEVGGLDLILELIPQIKYCISPKGIERGVPRPRGILLAGLPGSGKTFISSVFAAELGWPTIALSVDAVCDGGAPVLNQMLAAIESMAPCVLYLDEIDKLFAAGSDRQVLGAFLTWLQEHQAEVYTFGTLNWLSNLPSELTRDGRFDGVYGVGFPMENARLQLFEIYLGRFDPRYKNILKACSENELRLLAESTINFLASEIAQTVYDVVMDLGMRDIYQISVRDVLDAVEHHSTLYKRNPDPIDLMLREINGKCKPAETDSEKYISKRKINAY
jgi:ATPase family associated with various cellular activities (AAA)